MNDICIFRRIEKKYRLCDTQYKDLFEKIGNRLIPDFYGHSTVSSLYLDTDNSRLIRESLDAICYKEKLRLRCYGNPTAESKAFLELKKKYNGVVYKRRLTLTVGAAEEYFRTGIPPVDSQIMREIDYTAKVFGHIRPAMMIAYERDAYGIAEDESFRLTLDSNPRYRTDRLTLTAGADGTPLLPRGNRLMEIKTTGGMPLWLVQALNDLQIYPSSFSKYGTAYRNEIHQQGEKNHAANF